MKKGVTITILVFIALIFFGALYYLYAKNQEPPVVFQTDKTEIKTIVKNTIATGNIVPDEEVLIKPNISGIIEAVYIKAGETIKAGDLIAKIKVVANVSNLSSTQNQVQTAKINLDNQEKLYQRLFSSSSLSAIRVVPFAYLRLLLFLLAVLIPACVSSSPTFLMMYSA